MLDCIDCSNCNEQKRVGNGFLSVEAPSYFFHSETSLNFDVFSALPLTTLYAEILETNKLLSFFGIIVTCGKCVVLCTRRAQDDIFFCSDWFCFITKKSGGRFQRRLPKERRMVVRPVVVVSELRRQNGVGSLFPLDAV